MKLIVLITFTSVILALSIPTAGAMPIKDLAVGTDVIFTADRTAELTECAEVSGFAFLRCRLAGPFFRRRVAMTAGTNAVVTKIRRVSQPGAVLRFIGYDVYLRIRDCAQDCGRRIRVGRMFTVAAALVRRSPYGADFELEGVEALPR